MRYAIAATFAVVALLVAACQKDAEKPADASTAVGEAAAPSPQRVFAGEPRFPRMSVALPNGLELVFIGGPATKDERNPVVGDEGVRSLSHYELREPASGKVLGTSPSMIVDPRLVRAGQPQAAHEFAGEIEIWVSESGRTLLICENYSIATLNEAFLLLQQDFSNAERWSSSQLRIPTQPYTGISDLSPLAYGRPAIRGISDSAIRYKSDERISRNGQDWEISFIDIPRRN